MEQNMIKAQNAFERFQYANALRFYQQAKIAHPENPQVLMGIAKSYSEMGEFSKAITACDEMLNLDSKLALAHAVKAEVYAKQKNIPESKREIDLAYQIAPTDLGVLASYARVLFLDGQEDESIKYLEKALEQDPKQYDVYHNLSFIYNKKGNLEKLLFCAEKIYELRPTVKNRIRLAVVRLRQKRLYSPLAGSAILLLLVTSIVFHSWGLFSGAILIVLLMAFLRMYLNTP